VGVKAEIVKTDVKQEEVLGREEGDEEDEGGDGGGSGSGSGVRGATGSGWVEMSIEIPGYRDDDALPVFLAEMMREAVLAGGEGLMERLRVNRRWHWKIYVDVSYGLSVFCCF
jgi:exosome complex component RRP42